MRSVTEVTVTVKHLAIRSSKINSRDHPCGGRSRQTTSSKESRYLIQRVVQPQQPTTALIAKRLYLKRHSPIIAFDTLLMVDGKLIAWKSFYSTATSITSGIAAICILKFLLILHLISP